MTCGARARIAKAYAGRYLMRTVGEILDVARETTRKARARPRLVIDDAGVGGGVTDRLRELDEFEVVAFNGAERAFGDYPNRRSENWVTFAERLDELDLDDDEQLAADLVAPRYSLDSKGRRVVEAKVVTKRRLGRSPDRADAVVLTFAAEYAGAFPTIVDSPGGSQWITAGLLDRPL